MILNLSKYNHLITLNEKSSDDIVSFKGFPDIDDNLKANSNLFSDLLKQVTPRIKTFKGLPYIDQNDYNMLRLEIDKPPLGRNATPMFLILYSNMISGKTIDFGEISESSAIALCEFAATFGKLIFNLNMLNAQMNKDFITASNVLKESFFQRSIKEFYILQKWLIDWAKYLLKEKIFNTSNMPHFKQGDIVRVDFGWRIGSEFGGIHYAIVIEKNNNPSNPMIFLVPMSSYEPGYRINRNDVDLGKCVGNKYSFAVLTQTGSYSKMRVLDNRIHGHVSNDILTSILSKLSVRFGIFHK